MPQISKLIYNETSWCMFKSGLLGLNGQNYIQQACFLSVHEGEKATIGRSAVFKFGVINIKREMMRSFNDT